MQFVRDREYFKIARITGNHYNLLAIKLAHSKCPITINGISNKPNEIINLKADRVLDNVLQGLDKANNVLNKNYYIEEVQYIVSDTEPYEVYSFLMENLIYHIDLKKAFDDPLPIKNKNIKVVETLTIDLKDN